MKNFFLPAFIIFLALTTIAGFFGFLFWLFSGEPSATQLAQLHLIWYV